MAPQINADCELRFQVSNRQTLLVRELTPKSNADFIASTSGGLRQDQGVLSVNSSAGIAENAFYTGLSRIKGMAPGGNVHILGSRGQKVMLVQLEDN